MKPLAAAGCIALLFNIMIDVQRGAAQDERLYAGVSGMLSMQGSERPGGDSGDPSVPRAGVGGTTWGTTGEFGGFLTPRLSLSFEASLPARFEAAQEIDYFAIIRLDNQHRDLFLTGLVHLHFPIVGKTHAAVVGGLSIVEEDTEQSRADQTNSPLDPQGPIFSPYRPAPSISRWTWALTGGLDIAVELTRRVQLVPQIRVHWIQRATLQNSPDSPSAELGLSAFVFRPAIGLRLGF